MTPALLERGVCCDCSMATLFVSSIGLLLFSTILQGQNNYPLERINLKFDVLSPAIPYNYLTKMAIKNFYENEATSMAVLWLGHKWHGQKLKLPRVGQALGQGLNLEGEVRIMIRDKTLVHLSGLITVIQRCVVF